MHGEQDTPRARSRAALGSAQRDADAAQRLAVRACRVVVEADDLARRTHLTAERRVDPEALEGEHALARGDVTRNGPLADAELVQGLAQHHLGGDAHQREAGRAGHERRGSPGAWLDVENHDGARGDREPHADEADEPGFQGDCAYAILDACDDLRVEREGREDCRGVAAMHERGLEVLHHPGDDDARSVGDGVDVDGDCLVERAVIEMASTGGKGGSTSERRGRRAEHADTARGEVCREA